ncbi:MAG: hypothetical protein NVSMB33_05980 [Ktedonobacteraceae bacterium]
MLVALLATVLLALSTIFAIIHYYSIDQHTRLANFGSDSAQSIGMNYTQNYNLFASSAKAFPTHTLTQSYQGEQYLLMVFNRRYQPVYPPPGTVKNPITAFYVALADPALRNKSNVTNLRDALIGGEQGTSSIGELGSSSPVSSLRPFIVQPIFKGGQSNAPVIGVLLITPRSAAENTIPPFIAAVEQSVIIVTIIIALLAALAAILFSRTITRPLAHLTEATRVLASGDYNAQVTIKAHGEIDELATTFNEMATQLASDVNELRQQELWRRELIMNITHDLATPLTAIAGLGESLVDGVNQSREDYEATGRIIVRETLRLRRLVKDLHIMARVEAKALQPQRQSVRLAALVDQVLAVLATEFERTNIEPCNTIPYTLPPVQADPDMLTRVFSNLCDNALRHTPAGGIVTVNATQQDNQLMISVTDSGEGIPSNALPRVFDRFYRADSARQSSTGGSGLGLAIVRAIVEAHGGTVYAENVSEGGARISFTLPLTLEPYSTAP